MLLMHLFHSFFPWSVIGQPIHFILHSIVFNIQNNENLHSPLSSFFWHVQKGTSFASVINQYLSEALRTLSDQDAESFAHCFTLNESSHYGGSDCVSAITKVGLACLLHHSTSTDSVHVFPDQIRTYIPWRFTFLGLRKWCSPTLLPWRPIVSRTILSPGKIRSASWSTFCRGLSWFES